jgi:hypothetical protein
MQPSDEDRAMPCPRHPEAAPGLHSSGGEYWVRCQSDYLRDDAPECWCGPTCSTKSEAIAEWNALATAREAGRRAGIEEAAVVAETWPKGGPTWSGAQAADAARRIRALAGGPQR